MENFIKQLKISNFKSIREAELECGRVNLFVGKPNVGKSNVLEALSLLGACYSKSKNFMTEFIRYKNMRNWFFYNEFEKPIFIDSNIGSASCRLIENYGIFEFQVNLKHARPIIADNGVSNENKVTLSQAGMRINSYLSDYSPVKKYVYRPKSPIRNRDKHLFLTPPDGKNLFSVFESNSQLKEMVPDMFSEFGLEFVLDVGKKEFEIQRKIGKVVHKIPYYLIADTLQRMIFHYSAIFSNKDSVILFEEPESHSFLPYVSDLAYYISQDNENQYFIATHSPHLFTKIVEESENPAIFITHWDNYETKFKKLTKDEICELLDYGIDIFFNTKYFLDEPTPENIA